MPKLVLCLVFFKCLTNHRPPRRHNAERVFVAALVAYSSKDPFMTRFAALLLLLPVFLSTAARAQLSYPNFCNAGLRPDGYIDLTDLPPAPNFPTASNGPPPPSAPISVSLQVHGIPGLAVQLTIPVLQPLSPGPVYSVSRGLLTLNSLNDNGGQLQLQFSQPVAGLGAIAVMAGRGADFAITSNTNLPLNYSTSNNSVTVVPHFQSSPLQEVVLQGPFTQATLSVSGGDFGLATFGNLRVQSTSAASASASTVPTQGLEMWLKSESVTSQFAGSASSWPDQSGNGHDATQTNLANQPGEIEQDGNTCRGAFLFSQNQFFNFELPIDGWQEMTVFLVAKSLVDPQAGTWEANSAAIFWNENAPWGNTFVTPYQQTAAFRFGTTQAGNQPFYTRPATIGQDFSVTRAVHNGSTDSLYVDSQLVSTKGTKLPVLSGTTGAGFIGRGINNTYFTGEISEILVYDRVLTSREAAAVEYYLRNKFGTR
jgi:Concanavalin A-like lectin/glucanases superfamily